MASDFGQSRTIDGEKDLFTVRACFVLAIASVAMCLLTACPPSESLTIYNDSESERLLLLPAGEKPWRPKSVIIIADDRGDLSWEDLEWRGDPSVRYVPRLSIDCDGAEYSFEMIFPDMEDKHVGGDGVRKYRLQLNQDCRFFLVPFEAAYPVQISPDSIEIKPVPRTQAARKMSVLFF